MNHNEAWWVGHHSLLKRTQRNAEKVRGSHLPLIVSTKKFFVRLVEGICSNALAENIVQKNSLSALWVESRTKRPVSGAGEALRPSTGFKWGPRPWSS